jgi:hypothetical protein
MKIQITLLALTALFFSSCKEVICKNEGKKGSDVLGNYVIEDCQPWYYESLPSLAVWVIDANRNTYFTEKDFKADQIVKLFSNESDYTNNRNEIAKGITDKDGKVFFPKLDEKIYYVRSEIGCVSSFGLGWGGVDLKGWAHRRVSIQLFRGASQTIFLNNQTNDSCFSLINNDNTPGKIGPQSIYIERRPADTDVKITVTRRMGDTTTKTYQFFTNKPCSTDTTFYIR